MICVEFDVLHLQGRILGNLAWHAIELGLLDRSKCDLAYISAYN